jgi:hypothetical protein
VVRVEDSGANRVGGEENKEMNGRKKEEKKRKKLRESKKSGTGQG